MIDNVEQQNKESFRPYAAPANVLGFLARVRRRNLPETITNDFLRVAGIPEVVFGRVMQALRFLKLVHEDGRPTDTLVALSGATDAQYREVLEKVIREAYRTEFQVIDPSKDMQARIIDAFRQFQPRSQTERMVMLFLGLCREAGIPVLEAPRERLMHEKKPKRPKPSGSGTSKATADNTDEGKTPPRIESGILFGVTEDDVARLSEEEFKTVWTALGTVARARARARMQQEETPNEEPEDTTQLDTDQK